VLLRVSTKKMRCVDVHLIALRRASLFGRAPMVHDLNLALAMWGFLSDSPPSDLVSVRKELFHGVGNAVHHYKEGRDIADMIPEINSAYVSRRCDVTICYTMAFTDGICTMTIYSAPLADINFVLEKFCRLNDITSLPHFANVDTSVVG